MSVDKSRWNVDRNKDYAQANNKENRIHNHGDPDFYVTLHHAGDADNMIRLDAPINVRVTRPIIANNAGGAGYLSIPDSYVSLHSVAQDFLNTLKAANFNTGNSHNPSAAVDDFSLKNIAGGHQP